ncbi:MAG: hypothetical protein E5X49_19265 [Mesorhizobium sp.]|nr:MAG: hypothetical protein E5X49_19265 [Mesorhizobium sp.]
MGELRAALSRFFTILAAGLLAMTVLTTPEPATAKCDDIPMAVVGPMTGDWAYDGEEMRRGAQLAVDDIDAKGGIRGCKIALTVLDDQYTPATIFRGRLPASIWPIIFNKRISQSLAMARPMEMAWRTKQGRRYERGHILRSWQRRLNLVKVIFQTSSTNSN